MSGFESLGLSRRLTAVVSELGYTEPTEIQRETIPLLLAGKDVVGQSKTGSGKTAAFSLPILEALDLENRALQALIVCPTRELCAQVAREMRRLARKHPGLQVLPITGGTPIRPQLEALARGAHIAVGTPGRLLDHLKRGSLDLDAIRTVVLDEADRMLDMGFRPDVEAILDAVPESRQTALFSATFPATIATLSADHQRQAQHIKLSDSDDETPTIDQRAITVRRDDKLHALYWLLAEHPHESALVFCNFKATVADVDSSLASSGVSVDCLHGDLEQFDRDRVLARFRNGSIRVLVATDVAGRGLDVKDLDLVVNYELPQQPEVYVHRIGRTGRAGKNGLTIALATPRERSKLRQLEALTGQPIEPIDFTPGGDDELEALADKIAGEASMKTILISGGRKDKIRPGDILGALTGDAAGLPASAIGKIEIHDRLTYVAVAAGSARLAVRGLNHGRIKARRFRATLLT